MYSVRKIEKMPERGRRYGETTEQEGSDQNEPPSRRGKKDLSPRQRSLCMHDQGVKTR
jgi:hypothetical protein